MNRILLTGCSPTPLAHYLKALGVLRLVAEQADTDAKGAWRDDGFELLTNLNQDELLKFFLHEYRPTPILAPWNGRAGYLEGDDAEDSTRAGAKLIKAFREAGTNRLAFYRELISAFDCNTTLRTMNSIRWEKKKAGIEKKLLERNKKSVPDTLKDQIKELGTKEAALKESIIREIKNELPDDMGIWIDALVALTDQIGTNQRKDKYFSPLLGGSGGVEGSMDIGVNFMSNLQLLIDIDTGVPAVNSNECLLSSLMLNPAVISSGGMPGSMLPGQKGGPNSTTGFTTKLGANPWDFVLMIEGAVVCTTTITKRLDSATPAELSFPFTFEITSAASGKLSKVEEGGNRYEFWAPIWSQPASAKEVMNFFKEGRLTLRYKSCLNGLDAARAISLLGQDRGVDAFYRSASKEMPGGELISMPIGRVQVTSNPSSELISDLDQGRRSWLDSLRRAARAKEASNGLRSAVQTLENALFDFTHRATALTVQAVLIRIGELTQWQANSRKGREANLNLPKLSHRWLTEGDDRSNAFRVASALASIGSDNDLPLRAHLFPLAKDKPKGWVLSEQGENALHVWSDGPLPGRLADLLLRRLLASRQDESLAFDLTGNCPVDIAGVNAFLESDISDNSIAALLPALSLIKLFHPLPGRNIDFVMSPPLAYRTLKPLFTSPQQLREAGVLQEGMKLNLPPRIPRLLIANRLKDALELAQRHLRIAGINGPKQIPSFRSLDGARLLGALLLPIHTTSLRRLMRATFNLDKQPDNEHDKPEAATTE